MVLFLELGQGKSYWNRLRFLDTCEFVIELFSKSFFCKYFFLPAIELTHDPVANVRYGYQSKKIFEKCILMYYYNEYMQNVFFSQLKIQVENLY